MSGKIAQLIPDKRRVLEISGVVATAIGKVIFMDVFQWRLPFILVIIFCWTSYVIYRSARTPGILKYWGFRADNFKRVMLMVLPYGMVAIVLFFITGYWQGTINLSWHIFPVLVLYPIWGTIQQFLVIALVAGNLEDLRVKRFERPAIIIFTALLFGLIHYPFNWLMLGTFLLALFYGYIYFRERNIFVMGIFHGWLGALFFYTVVNRDPFLEVFGKLLND